MTPYEMIEAENAELKRMLHREHDRAVKLKGALTTAIERLNGYEDTPANDDLRCIRDGSPSRPDNLSIGSALSDTDEH